MRNDPYKDVVWLLALGGLGFGAYWAYQNGWLGYFGACPSGFTASSGVCVNSGTLNSPSGGGSAPTTPLEPGMAWAWQDGAWMQVPASASWNPTVTL